VVLSPPRNARPAGFLGSDTFERRADRKGGFCTLGCMQRLLTERQAEVVELAGRLAAAFAERAPEHDAENTFPAENWPVMAEAGFLGLTVPKELGGFDADVTELLLAAEHLAQGCASTALAVNMHLTTAASFQAIWRRTGDGRAADFLRKAATGEVVLASCTSEAGYGGAIEDCATAATRVGGGFLLDGRKIFFTESDVATHFTTCAKYEHPSLGPQMVFFNGIPIDTPGLTVVRTWDTMGMRATQSNDLVLEGVFVPEECLFHAFPVGRLDATIGLSVWSINVPTFGAVALGIAAGGMEWARAGVVRQGRQGDPEVQRAFAEMEVLLETARATLYRHGHEILTFDRSSLLSVEELFARGNLAKYVACENAVQIMQLVVEIVGGAGYHRRFPIERMYRDVRAGAIMPDSSPAARKTFARISLGIESRQVFDYGDSAGHAARVL
jgi:alkylation response protein AidB-like acyl-CoA dehydrogenase